MTDRQCYTGRLERLDEYGGEEDGTEGNGGNVRGQAEHVGADAAKEEAVLRERELEGEALQQTVRRRAVDGCGVVVRRQHDGQQVRVAGRGGGDVHGDGVHGGPASPDQKALSREPGHVDEQQRLAAGGDGGEVNEEGVGAGGDHTRGEGRPEDGPVDVGVPCRVSGQMVRPQVEHKRLCVGERPSCHAQQDQAAPP